jgi:RNA polymerase sigma-70 factor (ECF subfamily)
MTTNAVLMSGNAEPRASPSPEALARQCREGRAESFDEILEQFGGRIHRFLLRMTGNSHDAEDLTQETFLRAYKSIGRYDPDRPFSAWIYAIARKTAAGYFRSRRPTDELENEPACGTNEHPATKLEREDETARVWEAASRLKPQFHEVLLLHYAEGFPVAETARVMGLTVVHTKVILHRAREQLSRRLRERTE